MATITFTATGPDGIEHTRSSGTMPYVAVVLVSKDQETWGDFSWHKSVDAAQRAAAAGYPAKIYPYRKVVAAVPTKVNGKVEAGHFADWPAGVPELVAAKLAQR